MKKILITTLGLEIIDLLPIHVILVNRTNPPVETEIPAPKAFASGLAAAGASCGFIEGARFELETMRNFTDQIWAEVESMTWEAT